MKMYTLECPHCGAPLEIEDGVNTFYCKYCGYKIILSGMSKAELRAKLKLKEWEHDERMQVNSYSHQERIQEREIEQERYILDKKQKHERWKERKSKVGIVLCISFLMIPGIIMALSSKIKDIQTVNSLEKIEAEIQNDISTGDYDSALLKTNNLYYDVDWSDDTEKLWKKKRKDYIDLIREKMEQSARTDSQYAFPPFKSKDCDGKSYTDMTQAFEDAGFTNVETVAEEDDALLFKKTNKVDKVTINGKEEFTTEEFFERDAIVKVYYFQ